MGAAGHLNGQSVALEKVLRTIVNMFMDEKLTYRPLRTMQLDRTDAFAIERLRVARRSSRLSASASRLWGPVEESKAG